MSLPFEMDPETSKKQEEEVEEKITYERRKRKSAYKGRVALPDHLAVEEIKIYHEGDLSEMVYRGRNYGRARIRARQILKLPHHHSFSIFWSIFVTDIAFDVPKGI